MNRVVSFLLCVLLLPGFSSCDSIENPAPLPAAEEALTSAKPMLPATKTPQERQVDKADQFGDYKSNQPQVYGITTPPSVPVRPVAEWEPASKLLISYSTTSLPAGIRQNLIDIATYGSQVSEVVVVHDEAAALYDFQNMMAQVGLPGSAVDFQEWPNDSIWMRDFGPVSIIDNQGRIAFADFRYYHQRVYDDAIPYFAATTWNVTDYRVPLEYEGGNFMSDTKGNCFASQGLLYANGVGETTVKQYMKSYLGCSSMYLVKPLANEGTTHIDMQAKLVSDSTVIVGSYGYGEDAANYAITNQNAALFESLGYDVVRMPMPTNQDGNFRSFINSLFVNGVNMVPVYTVDQAKKAEAMALWQQAMPDWQHVPFLADDVISWSGAIHCVTMTVGNGQLTPIETPAYACNGDWSCYPDGSTTQPTGCGDVSYQGCCDGELLQWCENGQLQSANCAQKQHCGWDADKGFYNCGTAGQPDPAGLFPMSCDGGCQPDCTGKVCGDDGCGGSCGMCGAGEACTDGQCVAGPTAACGEITYAGCCNGSILTWCEEGALKTLDCTANPSCGWDAAKGFYNCGTAGQADPAGAWPLSCTPQCVPDCAGRACGNDGCGGTCGMCTGGTACVAGVCEQPETVIPDDGCPPGYALAADGMCRPVDEEAPADEIGTEEFTGRNDSGCTASPARRPLAGALLLLALTLLLATLRSRKEVTA